MVTPHAKRPVADYLKATHQLSERRACQLLTFNRGSYRYQAISDNNEALRNRLKQLALQYPVYGYLMLHALLKQEGLVINRKKTWRLYIEAQLQVRTKRRAKLVRPRQVMTIPSQIDQRWSMDFVSDQLSDGRRFRVLNVVDDYSRECVGQIVATSITGQRVARFLNELIEQRQKPQTIVCDNGTEFTSKTMFFWSKENNVTLSFIQPGKPTQNAFVESFNGKFRAGCLNLHWFRDLYEAKEEIEQWRCHYNHVRPHSALNYLSSVQYVNQAA